MDIGMVGLGVMGRNLVLNLADHGYKIAGYDRDASITASLKSESAAGTITGTPDLAQFMKMLKRPRSILVLVPAGPPVDAVLNDLQPFLEQDDLVIDAGNSFFKDTDNRILKLSAAKAGFMGMGISGGEEGARHGPSMMPGGRREHYERVRPMLEAAAAKVNGQPCVAWLGNGSAGHFVKMVHNGIEYALMQIISESYDILKRGLGFTDDQLHNIYAEWNDGKLNGFLMEITSLIFNFRDEKTGKKLVDEILDVAMQKGTGMWTSQSAMELQVPVPAIDMAVGMRDLSVFRQQRNMAGQIFERPIRQLSEDRASFPSRLQNAVFACMIMSYAQGMSVLAVASEKYGYDLKLGEVIRVWKGGCIIRAAVLYDFAKAFGKDEQLPNLLLDKDIAALIIQNQEDLRKVIAQACQIGIPVPAMMSCLGYLDACRSPWLPANLIQAQRDFFGSHTYERIDSKGTYHTKWRTATT